MNRSLKHNIDKSDIQDLLGVELNNKDVQLRHFKKAQLVDYYPIKNFKYARNYDLLKSKKHSDISLDYNENENKLIFKVNNLISDYIRVENNAGDLFFKLKEDNEEKEININIEENKIGENTFEKYKIIDCYEDEKEHIKKEILIENINEYTKKDIKEDNFYELIENNKNYFKFKNNAENYIGLTEEGKKEIKNFEEQVNELKEKKKELEERPKKLDKTIDNIKKEINNLENKLKKEIEKDLPYNNEKRENINIKNILKIITFSIYQDYPKYEFMEDYKKQLICKYVYDYKKETYNIDEHIKDFDFDKKLIFGLDNYYDNMDHVQEGYICYIKILYNELKDSYYYFVDEPNLSEYEKELLDNIYKELRNVFDNTNPNDIIEKYDKLSKEQSKMEFLKNEVNWFEEKYFKSFTSKIVDKITGESSSFNQEEKVKMMYYIARRIIYSGELTCMMKDRYIEEINVNGYGKPIYINHQEYASKDDCVTNLAYSRNEVDERIRKLSKQMGVSITKRDPAAKGSLQDGSRIQAELGEGDITDSGGVFTIRKFQDVPFTPRDLIGYGSFSSEVLAYIWYSIDKANASILVSGGTASGKTTATNVLTFFFQPREKIITIEDTRELTIQEQNKIHKKTKKRLGETDNIEYEDLLVQALREKPVHIVVGEVRASGEAKKMTEAANTGHQVYSTFHADSVNEVVNRLSGPLNVGKGNITAIDLVLLMEQNKELGRRLMTGLNEFTDYDGGSDTIGTDRIASFNNKKEEFEFDKNKINSKILKDSINNKGTEEFFIEINNREGLLKYLCRSLIPRYEVNSTGDIDRNKKLRLKFNLEREIIKKYTSHSNKDSDKIEESKAKDNPIIDLLKTGKIYDIVDVDVSKIDDIINRDIKIPKGLYKTGDKFIKNDRKYTLINIDRGKSKSFNIKYNDGEEDFVGVEYLNDSEITETRNQEQIDKILRNY